MSDEIHARDQESRLRELIARLSVFSDIPVVQDAIDEIGLLVDQGKRLEVALIESWFSRKGSAASAVADDAAELIKRLQETEWGLNVTNTLCRWDADRAEAADMISRQCAQIEELKGVLRYIQKQWPDSFAARHAVAYLWKAAGK